MFQFFSINASKNLLARQLAVWTNLLLCNLSNISSSQLTGVLLLLLLVLSLACNISDVSLLILILIAHSLKLVAGIC